MSTATALAKEITTAKVGQPAPNFDLPSTKNIETLTENVKLADYAGKWLILLFYPLDFTFVCPTELTAFSDRIEELNGIGAEVIGISTDSVHSHRAWIKTPRDENGVAGLQYPLASDTGGRLARAYNILVEEENIALRGLYIINPEGILQYAVVHDLNIGRSVDETLRVLQGLQTGGLCSADWTPGQENLTV
ncbi:MAG: Alkyl hydroperoxide reductase subunit C-like protein [uncultured Pyrinomonadaceae bacterium]|uniref:Alkyl hydroperoxide reductase C n=1 Tax=uncultured Pyrinomonadaceae bacterium TaxID=2283094 RepID=A0A6J4NTV3_9BACT|nr:MAG: Alkyl hydroperoxide reductase subunit C-like protein [uncultured Pyrinomonadaceae bacterium]